MKRTAYDRRGAEHLLPLIRSIASEILERSDAIEALEERLLALRSTCKNGKPSDEYLDAQSELSSQRREARLSRLELARLGCTLDEDRPLRVLIPGVDGSFDSGYAWDGTLNSLVAAAPATT
jgi:hypothetical protein